MKKIPLLLLLVTSLILCMAATTPAADTGRVYVDTMIGGTVKNDDLGLDGDANETYIGFELPVDKFKLNLELLTGNWEREAGDLDLKGYEIKGGYQVLKNKDLQMYITLSDYNRESNDYPKPEFSGILLGADVISNLSPKINVEGSLGFSLSGKYEDDIGDEDANLLLFKAKLNYMITKDVYASVGYRYYGFDVDHFDEDVKSKGLTLGVGFKF